MQTSHPLNLTLFVPFVVAALVCASLFAGAFVSRMSGWHELAERFALQDEFPSEHFRFRSARMKRGINYNNCLTIGASPVGFSIAMPWLFRMAHPPLFIPWSEISVVHTKIFWLPMVQFNLGREMRVPFTVREKLAEQIRQAAGASWPEAPGTLVDRRDARNPAPEKRVPS
jgi:hypothetical protein